LDGSFPDLRGQLAALVNEAISLESFQEWFWASNGTIEQRGTDEDVSLLNLVANRLAEYTSDYINASELVEALRTDPLICNVLANREAAIA
jgi:hypothetical protein